MVVDVGLGGVEPHVVRIGPASYRDEHLIEGGGIGLVAVELRHHLSVVPLEAFDGSVQLNAVGELLQTLLERRHEVGVDAGHETVGCLGDGDAAPEDGVHRSQLESHVAAPNHEQALWNGLEPQRRGGIPDEIVEGGVGERRGA